MDEFEKLLLQLAQVITTAKKSMFSGSDVIVNRAEVMDLIDRIRDAYPEVIREAQYIVQNSEREINETREYCKKLLSDTEARQNKMLDESEIIRIATDEANEIKRVANDIRARAEYEVLCKADNVLSDSEVTLRDALTLIRNYREELREPKTTTNEQNIDNNSPQYETTK